MAERYKEAADRKPLPLLSLPDDLTPPKTITIINQVAPDAIVTVIGSGQVNYFSFNQQFL